MQTRRTILLSMAGLVGGTSVAFAQDEKSHPAKLIPGNPPLLDFGEGVNVPCDKRAFLTLWEGDTFWLTFGSGTSPRAERAKAEAVHHASGAMKYLLLTLAFAPDRLQKVPGNGWRQKIDDPSSYVLGELEMPGHPNKAATDSFMGFGDADTNFSFSVGPVLGAGPNSSMLGAASGGQAGVNPALMMTKLHAFSSYFILKSDLSLDDVQKRAKDVMV